MNTWSCQNVTLWVWTIWCRSRMYYSSTTQLQLWFHLHCSSAPIRCLRFGIVGQVGRHPKVSVPMSHWARDRMCMWEVNTRDKQVAPRMAACATRINGGCVNGWMLTRVIKLWVLATTYIKAQSIYHLLSATLGCNNKKKKQNKQTVEPPEASCDLWFLIFDTFFRTGTSTVFYHVADGKTQPHGENHVDVSLWQPQIIKKVIVMKWISLKVR